MAMPLEDYLRIHLPARKREIEQIGETAGKVLASFDRAFDTKREAWPYLIDAGVDPAAAVNKNYSFSTNAMVLFALQTVLGDFQGRATRSPLRQSNLDWETGHVSILTPMMACADPDIVSDRLGTFRDPDERKDEWKKTTERLRGPVTTTFAKMVENVSALLSGGRRITRSNTFGDDDPFTLCWLLESLPLEHVLDAPSNTWVTNAYERAVKALSKPQEFKLLKKANEASPHALPILRTLQLYQRILQVQAKPAVDLSTVKGWFEARVHEHLSYAGIPDSSFDAPELIFALEGLLITEPHALGLERLLQRVIEVVHDKQQHNPNLRPYRPILSDQRGSALLPLTIEVFGSLLRIFERLAAMRHEMLKYDQARSILERYATWLLGQHRRINTRTLGEISGWSSEHTNSRNCIHVWETSQVLLFLVHYRAWLREDLQRKILEVANFTTMRPVPKKYMPRTSAKCQDSEPNAAAPLYQPIWRYFVEPRLAPSEAPRGYSMLLYGPPGTGKTTFAEYVAGMLGAELLTITPSDFIEGGDQGVEARAKAIFRALEELSNKVILFDEIDRLLLDRNSSEYAKQKDIFQFMTPSMLTKIRNLRRAEKCIFVIATNFEDKIDPAIKRSGRIDHKLLVLPPDLQARRTFIVGRLADRSWTPPATSTVIEEIAKSSALYTFTELTHAVRETFENTADISGALNSLLSYVKDHGPEISLRSYASRFNCEIDDDNVKPSEGPPLLQTPGDEYEKLYKIAQETGDAERCGKIEEKILDRAKKA